MTCVRFHSTRSTRGLLGSAALGLSAALSLVAAPARADVDARRLLEAVSGRVSAARTARALGTTDRSLALTVRLPPGVTAEERGLVPITPSIAVARGSAAHLLGLMQDNPDLRFGWSGRYRPLLDHAGQWTSGRRARENTGLSGQGVVVGVIDTGVDTKHPALRRPDGKTRVRWLVDFAREPLGRHPDLEAQYGCRDRDTTCAVLDASDIDELLENDVEGDEPTDEYGHGTHVASLAVGNGAPDDLYVGSAPEADLIVAQVTSVDGYIADAAILMAARFAFDRARELDQPAVLNISLGSDFGAHDGGSGLELALAELAREPGRSIVIAAGNSAGLYAGLTPRYPEPFGVHTEVHVPKGGETIVPILTPADEGGPIEGTIYAWIAGKAGDELRVGVDLGGDRKIPPFSRGEVGTYDGKDFGDPDDLEISVLNGVRDAEIGLAPSSAIVVISGRFAAGRTFGLRLEGNASANIWLASDGDLDPVLSLGALLPKARKNGTICVPATHPELIAVGATLNRTTWTDAAGARVEEAENGALEDSPEDSIAYFSSSGPTNTGRLKPDLVAPGFNVVGAMSKEADPRVNPLSDFGSGGLCADPNDECYVVSDHYAVLSGTSMASPVVAGAVALLMQREPTLTQARVRDLLQAGSRPLDGVTFAAQQVGAGALDVLGALLAQDEEGRTAADPTEAMLRLAESFAYPDPQAPLEGVVVLRDNRGQPATGYEARDLKFEVEGAERHDFERVESSLYRFRVAAPRGSGGGSLRLRVRFADAVLAEQSVPIAVDPIVAEEGFHARGGSCGWAPYSPGLGLPRAAEILAGGALVLSWARRRRRSV